MKDFISTFFICLVVCSIGVLFLGGVIFTNIWGLIIITALFLAILITAFVNQESRIKKLEKRMEQLFNGQQD